MFRLAVLSNPRSGTSLLTNLILTGFGLSKENVSPAFKECDGSSIYDYRILPKDLLKILDSSYKVFFILRDPRSVITSIHPSYLDNYLIDFKSWYNNYRYIKENFLYLNNVLTLKYEDLIKSPLSEQEKVSIFLGLEIKVPFSLCYSHYSELGLKRAEEMEIEMGGARPLNTTKIDRWKEKIYVSRIKQQLIEHKELITLLIEIGYETDDLWALEYLK